MEQRGNTAGWRKQIGVITPFSLIGRMRFGVSLRARRWFDSINGDEENFIILSLHLSVRME